ncbi:MAG: HIT family protein [Candidatus Hodarchaeales archaeon]
MTTDCLFCNSYQENKNKKIILFENNDAYTVLNYKPSVPGHSLIIPKQHVVDLKKINGLVLENFIHAIPLTYEAIRKIYDEIPTRIIEYYQSLVVQPPEPESKIFAEKMLNHPSLTIRPISYNWGMNVGYEAGQREVHIHIHLFPRTGSGFGIATAMRKHV